MFETNEYGKYWKNSKGQRHREDGPAVEYSNGTRYWYKDGKRHREDGPAVVSSDGSYFYYLEDKEYSEEAYWEEIEKRRANKEK